MCFNGLEIMRKRPTKGNLPTNKPNYNELDDAQQLQCKKRSKEPYLREEKVMGSIRKLLWEEFLVSYVFPVGNLNNESLLSYYRLCHQFDDQE